VTFGNVPDPVLNLVIKCVSRPALWRLAVRLPTSMMQNNAVIDEVSPPPPTCIVLERHGVWAAGFRRLDGSRSWRLREARGFVEVNDLLRACDRSLVAVELRGDAFSRTIAGIDHLLREFPRANCIALGNHVPVSVALLAWEAGAVSVINSPRQIARAATIVQRWATVMREHPTQQVVDEDIVKRIRRGLPFRAVAPNRQLPPSSGRRRAPENDDEPIKFEPLP